MKIWLDDVRMPPDESWVWFDSAFRVIDALHTLPVQEVSLDHDLGDETVYGNGYIVMTWIEREVYINTDYRCPVIHIHTANPVARDKMKAARTSIKRQIHKNQ